MELTVGKVAVVTGAASGIGLALAQRLGRAAGENPHTERYVPGFPPGRLLADEIRRTLTAP